MADDNDEGMVDKLILIGTSAAAAWAAQKVLSVIWKRATGHDAPKDPVHNESTIPAIVGFAAIGGAAAALSRILANRGARKVSARIAAGRALKTSR